MQASFFAGIPSQLVAKSIRCQYQRGCHALSSPDQSRCNHASRATFVQPSAHEDFRFSDHKTYSVWNLLRLLQVCQIFRLLTIERLKKFVRVCSNHPQEVLQSVSKRDKMWHLSHSTEHALHHSQRIRLKKHQREKLSVCAALLATCLPKRKRHFRDVCIRAIFKDFFGTNIQLPELATINSQQGTVRLCKTSADIGPESENQEVSL